VIALTVRQPYADRIVRGVKSIENRSRFTSVRGLVLIHAGGMIHDRYTRHVRDSITGRIIGELPRKAVVGVAQLVGCHNSEACPDRLHCLAIGGEFPTAEAPKVFHWELADVVRFETEIPRVNGALGFWHPDARVVDLATTAIAEAVARA
jgi:hypothetical protein